MDYRLYILAGTFLLLVLALVVFLSVLSRSRREEKFKPAQMVEHHPATLAGSLTRVDTDLGGLEVALSPDAASASLLTPLRTGEWQPPERPAPAERLSEAALTDRISHYAPPVIREPEQPVAGFSAWEVGPPVEETEAERISLHEPGDLPPAPRTMPAFVIPEVRPAEKDDDFGAEIAALLPAAANESESEKAADKDEEPLEIEAVQAVVVPAEEVAIIEGPPVSSRDDELDADIESLLEWRMVASEPDADASEGTVSVPPSIDDGDESDADQDQVAPVELLPVIVPDDAPSGDDAIPADTPVDETAEAAVDSPDELWQALLREQQGQRSMVPVPPVEAPLEHGAPVPEASPAVIEPAAAAEPPFEAPPPLSAPVPPAPAPVRPRVQPSSPSSDRPRARVAALDAIVAAPVEGAVAPVVAVPDGSREQAAGEMTLAAPVEMWFGESRVGVKAGSATYDRFRKYADVLLGDLKDAKAETR